MAIAVAAWVAVSIVVTILLARVFSLLRGAPPIEMDEEMADVSTVTATITRETNGWYRLVVSTIENDLSRVLIERPAASIVDAQRTAEEYASEHGALCYTVKVSYR